MARLLSMPSRTRRVSLDTSWEVRDAASRVFTAWGAGIEVAAGGTPADAHLHYAPAASGAAIEAALGRGFHAVLGPGFFSVFSDHK